MCVQIGMFKRSLSHLKSLLNLKKTFIQTQKANFINNIRVYQIDQILNSAILCNKKMLSSYSSQHKHIFNNIGGRLTAFGGNCFYLRVFFVAFVTVLITVQSAVWCW